MITYNDLIKQNHKSRIQYEDLINRIPYYDISQLLYAHELPKNIEIIGFGADFDEDIVAKNVIKNGGVYYLIDYEFYVQEES